MSASLFASFVFEGRLKLTLAFSTQHASLKMVQYLVPIVVPGTIQYTGSWNYKYCTAAVRLSLCPGDSPSTALHTLLINLGIDHVFLL